MRVLSRRPPPDAPTLPHGDTGPRRSAYRLLVGTFALILVGATATAQAQEDPYATVQDQAETSQLDTDVTPVAKETDLYTLVHGAPYPKTEVTEGSVTSFDTALHAVSFQNATIGLAAGSRCSILPEQQKGEDDATFAARANACEGTDQTQVPRIPAIYRYSEPPNQDPSWDRLELPDPIDPANPSNSGYVGAIAWIDANRALLVGGTGTYPRREQADDGNAPTDPQKRDVAGKARAWIYTRATAGARESLRELDLTSLTATTTLDGVDRAGMRGLSAVDCFEDPTPGRLPGGFGGSDPNPDLALCFAGALGQIWEFRDGAFNGERIDALSDADDLADASLFRYRVRDIAFAGLEPPVAAAVTAGCCATDQNENTPRLLVYDGATRECLPNDANNCGRRGPARWFARSFFDRGGTVATVPERATIPKQFQSADPPLRDFPCAHGISCTIDIPGGGGPAVPAETDNRRRELNDTPLWPDSFYSLMVNPVSETSFDASVIATPGGETSAERPSVISAAYTQPLARPGANLLPVQPELEVAGSSLSTARLLDGDSPSSDQWIPDASVGELRSTVRTGLGTQGLYVATVGKPEAQESVNASLEDHSCAICTDYGVRPTTQEIADGWEPIDQKKLDSHIRSQHYLLPSFTANAIDIVGDDEDAWIVGDHGAILRRDAEKHGASQGALEPKPPRLGAPRNKNLSDRSAYEDSRPKLPSEAGVVPPLGAETVQLDEPEMFSAGSVGPVKQIVMSRDGSEGWAIGQAPGGGPSFTYFDGTTWSQCDPLGIPGEVEPDPACEAMAPLRGYRANGKGPLLRVDLTHMARVPLENDPDDPTNDNELEIVAIGEKYAGPEYKGESHWAMVRYSDGRWSFEEPEAVEALDATPDTTVGGNNSLKGIKGIISTAFTEPDDGWLLAAYGTGGISGDGARLYHFDGIRWIDCEVERPICGDGGRIPLMAQEITGLTAAGDRVYLYGQRGSEESGTACNSLSNLKTWVCSSENRSAPMILYRDPEGEWTDGAGADEGGFDPAFSNPVAEEGRVDALSVVEGPDGFEAWAVGEFGGVRTPTGFSPRHIVSPNAALMRIDPDEGEGWQTFNSPGALEDYMIDYKLSGTPVKSKITGSDGRLQVGYPSDLGGTPAFIGQASNPGAGSRIFAFDAARERFELVDSARPQASQESLGEARPVGTLTAMAPDGHGGFWAAAGNHMSHYTDQPPKQPFEEVSNPLGIKGARLRALTGAPDGSVWAATDSDRLYRHDRLTGWEETRIGWDPGRVVTRTSQANEIAIGLNGEGLVVGEEGRIADLSPTGVILDAAAGRSCALNDAIPCGTSYDLHAVDVAPDGSAIAGGDRLSLLWRPAGGEFRAVPQKPLIGSSTRITAISMPTPERAYLATSAGTIFRGDHLGDVNWDWEAENVAAGGETISIGALRDVAVDASGHGYAAGAAGILERTQDGKWRKLPARYGGATAIGLPETGGPGVLVGGEGGRILAGQGSRLHVVRPDDFQGNAPQTGEVVGFAYLPGSAPETIDAWAGIAPASGATEGDSRLLRHRTDPADPLLDPTAATAALPDAPAHSDAELSLAAFGKSDCDNSEDNLCPEYSATTTTNEVVTGRIVDELSTLRETGELDLAVQSGDATDSAGLDASSLADVDRTGGFSGLQTLNFPPRSLAGQLKHRRYSELVTDELEEDGVPAFAAIGSQDLSETYACPGIPAAATDCPTTKRFANAGENYAWREAFAGRADPWGDGSQALETGEGGEIELVAAEGSEDNSLQVEDQSVDADGEGVAPEQKAAIGGAATHYAIDALRDGDALARIVFVDTSLGALAANDPLQQPHELAGGQQRFLERMICRQGDSTSFGDSCTRGPGQKAIVVSNTPTYSYGPGALSHTAKDANVFEALMLRHRVDLVVSGALGYNGLYYTLAPGIHEPCPGGAYPKAPPSGQTPDCLAGPTGPADAATATSPAEVPDPASVITEQGLAGAVPTLIAAGAGGKFGPDGTGAPDGPAGQWHGYSLARFLPSGDLVVEQRPILDWIGLDAPDHALVPRSRLKLSGYGRSPLSTATEGEQVRAFHYEISNPAITHRYDLLLADPERPTLPCRAEDPGCVELQANLASADAKGTADEVAASDGGHCAPYLCLPARIGTIDDQSGQVRAGDGRYPETFAVAMLSVDEEVATYPLVFKRSPSFVTSPSIRSGALPQLSGARPGAPPPPPPPPGLPQIPQVDVPQIPPPPGLPSLTAATPPELQPPAPPAPPPPSQQPTPLDLSVAPPGVSISTPTALIQPPTPPVNPAPPGGARREARQRQAAAQKGGADSDAESGESESGGSDATDSRTVPATRRDRVKAEPSFTALAASDQPSAWSRGALYGGGLTLASLILAMGYGTLRPTPRRRQPELPAPAQSQARRYRP